MSGLDFPPTLSINVREVHAVGEGSLPRPSTPASPSGTTPPAVDSVAEPRRHVPCNTVGCVPGDLRRRHLSVARGAITRSCSTVNGVAVTSSEQSQDHGVAYTG